MTLKESAARGVGIGCGMLIVWLCLQVKWIPFPPNIRMLIGSLAFLAWIFSLGHLTRSDFAENLKRDLVAVAVMAAIYLLMIHRVGYTGMLWTVWIAVAAYFAVNLVNG